MSKREDELLQEIIDYREQEELIRAIDCIDDIPMTGPIDPRVLDMGIYGVCVINQDIQKDRVITHRVRSGLFSKSPIAGGWVNNGQTWPIKL